MNPIFQPLRPIRLLGMSVLLWGLLSPSLAFSQASPADSLDPKMEWFGDAKLGIFIHWGIYAVKGIDESWSFFNEYLSHEDYMKQAAEFGAEQYDPAQWAKLIAGSGAQYAVLTTRHHDGFSLWDTEYGSFNAVDHAKAGRDLLTPFVAAIRKENLKVGLYYSLPDWSHEDYTHFTKHKRRYEIAEEPARWQRFQDYYRGQLGELSGQYRPDLWWFDGDWEHSAAEWQAPAIRQQLLADNPQTVINSRLTDHGDYATPEQGVPLTQPASPYWELCLTMNDSWGYQHNDHNYKSANQLIRMFVDCLRMGGNLLLDIGPKADGSIPAEQVTVLEEFGRWTRKHQEAIYGSRAGIPTDYFHGPTTLSKDRKTLYLFLPHRPNGPIALRGLKNQVNRIRVVGDGTKLSHHVHNKPYWSSTPGILYIDVPERVLDPEVTVLAIQLAGEIELQALD